MEHLTDTTTGWDAVEPRANLYYERLRLETAITIAKEMCAEWSYEDDAHGYCHQRSVIQRLVTELEGRPPWPPRADHGRPGWDAYFLTIAEAISARADCRRRRVGCVLVKDHRIVSTGYNGGPSGGASCLAGECPRGLLTYEQVAGLGDYDRPGSPGFCVAIHAEGNALLYADRDDARGSTAYITDPPCPGCRKLLAGAGVARAVWPGGEWVNERVTTS